MYVDKFVYTIYLQYYVIYMSHVTSNINACFVVTILNTFWNKISAIFAFYVFTSILVIDHWSSEMRASSWLLWSYEDSSFVEEALICDTKQWFHDAELSFKSCDIIRRTKFLLFNIYYTHWFQKHQTHEFDIWEKQDIFTKTRDTLLCAY